MNTPSLFSSPFPSELRTIKLLVRNIESSFKIVNDTLDDEFAELLPPPA